MLKYTFKRLLIFIPTLVAISLLAFIISINSPADPVEMLARSASAEGNVNTESSASESIKNEIRKKLGLDLPVFYLSVLTSADCDTLYKIASRSEQEALKDLTRQFGNWEEIQTYHQAAIAFAKAIKKAQNKNEDEVLREVYNEANFTALSLVELGDTSIITSKLQQMDQLLVQLEHEKLKASFVDLTEKHDKMLEESSKWKNYIPSLKWNGFDNQYHVWAFGDLFTAINRNRKGIIRGDFGNSFMDNQAVSKKIKENFAYSFFLVLISIVLAYLVSIPLGVYSAYKANSRFDSIASIITFMLYSLPSFFVGTWLLYYFANPDYFRWFPTGGVSDPSVFDPDWPWYKIAGHRAPYFVLPAITYTYSSFAFISRIMKVSMLDVLQQDYIRTARAKGLSEYQVVVKHGLKNALIPIVTMFANIFPAAVGGSVILETIFSIPGMGKEIYEAVVETDVPMIVGVFTITGILTVIGYLVADLMYAIIDPRIRYGK